MKDFAYSAIWLFCLMLCFMSFVIVDQLHEARKEVKQLEAKVTEHEEVIKQYEFYVWHNMKFFEEKEEEK